MGYKSFWTSVYSHTVDDTDWSDESSLKLSYQCNCCRTGMPSLFSLHNTLRFHKQCWAVTSLTACFIIPVGTKIISWIHFLVEEYLRCNEPDERTPRKMASLTLHLLQVLLLLVVSAAAWNLDSNYLSFYGGSMSFTPKGQHSDGTYKVSWQKYYI